MQGKFEEFDLYRLFLAVLGYRAEIKRYIEKNDLELPANVLTFQKSLDAQIEELAARFFGPGPNANTQKHTIHG